jgi:hypothetical protein
VSLWARRRAEVPAAAPWVLELFLTAEANAVDARLE